jgi:hypothetical protein
MFFRAGQHGKIAYTIRTPSESIRAFKYIDGGTRCLRLDEGEEDVEMLIIFAGRKRLA